MEIDRERRSGVALLIGIGTYEHADRIARIEFAAEDAAALAEHLADPPIGQFPGDRIKVLTDEEARRGEIVRHLSDWLPAQARGVDLAVIFFAGHGMVHREASEEHGYLLPYDADPTDLVTSGVALRDVARWLDQIDAGAVVVCLDCRHPGEVNRRLGDDERSIPCTIGIHPAVLHELAGKNRSLITACDEGQVSIKSPDLGHGLFTYHLLQGIAGAGDQDGDGRVGIAELFEYVARAVEGDATTRFGLKQKPWFSATGPAMAVDPIPEDKGDLNQLLARIQAGDEEAARELLIRYEPEVRRIVRRQLPRLLRSWFDSLDFRQSVWDSLFRWVRYRPGLVVFEDELHLIAFLCRAAKNKVIDEYRRAGSQKHTWHREEPN